VTENPYRNLYSDVTIEVNFSLIHPGTQSLPTSPRCQSREAGNITVDISLF